MDNPFFEQPILNSPYSYPQRHWELDTNGQPTQRIIEYRRRARFITPIPKAKKQRGLTEQENLIFSSEGEAISNSDQQYDDNKIIQEMREQVDAWRRLPNPRDWRVTPETERLLKHWRDYEFASVRPFFCQIEAVETLIWLTEVAPQLGKRGEHFWDHLKKVNLEANPDLLRIALKLATGAGKTTVMAMLIAWQTVNSVRYPASKRFSHGFLVVTPGLTIKDRLRVLQPNDPDSYYKTRELVPTDMLSDLQKAKIVITNYHAFKRRERLELARGSRALLQGRGNPELSTLETDGQMQQRIMPELMHMKNIVVINDEAHHCYREKPSGEKLKGEEAQEAKDNNEAARLWISGLEMVANSLGLKEVIDLSATPFFLRGSGYAEGTLFPWVMSDFSLMDALECGIVKLPRVPVSDNIPSGQMPMFRDLWKHVKADLPKKGRAKAENLSALDLPVPLQTALQALYGHYKSVFELWEKEKMPVPPCFIVVCNNTSTSKLVYDYISGFERLLEDGTTTLEKARLPLFSNFDEHGNPFGKPKTLLIDSEQLESGEALDDNFRKMAAPEIERFRRDIIERSGNPQSADQFTDQDLLREVMNTVGKEGRLGEAVRCVVSVSMLTEGWDANNVTHVLGVRAFGTQLLCEQVIGRALRRQSYELLETGVFAPEYADILGIPFDFTAKPTIAKPQTPRVAIQVKAMRPERDALEIRFPRVLGYQFELPEQTLLAAFTEDSKLVLTQEMVGATNTENAALIGQSITLNLVHTNDVRSSQILFELTTYLMQRHYRDQDNNIQLHLFPQLKRICKEWLENHLKCVGGTYPAQLSYKTIADIAIERIQAAIQQQQLNEGKKPVRAVLDPYNPTGSSLHVNFQTSKALRWRTDPRKCHINTIILDSDWEGEFCRIAELHPQVRRYIKNHALGFEVPYRHAGTSRKYIPDFIVLIEDGHGEDNLLNLVVEIKGYRGEDAIAKKNTIQTQWIPGVNALEDFGRWAFCEFRSVFEMEADFAQKLEQQFKEMIKTVTAEAQP